MGNLSQMPVDIHLVCFWYDRPTCTSCDLPENVCFVSVSVDKVTTDEELEEMLHRDNLSIFISDVSGISFSYFS